MLTRRSLLLASAAMFNSNGINQATADLQVRPSVRGVDATPLTGKVQVDPSVVAGAVNLIFDGQSTNSCCIGSAENVIAPFTGSTTGIYNLSLAHKGAVFQAADPLLSADIVLGHQGLYIARSLIDGGHATKVLITPVAMGGSYCADHCPGGGLVGGVNAPGPVTGDLSYRIGLAARCIANAGLSGLKTIIDWQQGEWDSDTTATTQANYTAALNGVIAEYKRVGLLRTGNVMFINQCTRPLAAGGTTTTDKNIIRAAQSAVVDGSLVRSGFDFDTIPDSDRYDHTHPTPAGAVLQAAGKVTGFVDFITNG